MYRIANPASPVRLRAAPPKSGLQCHPARVVKSVDTADLKSAASFIAGVPVRFRSRAPRGRGFKRVFELNRYAVGEIDETRKRVGSIPVSAPRGRGFKRVFELNWYAVGEFDETRKRVGSTPRLGAKPTCQNQQSAVVLTSIRKWLRYFHVQQQYPL